MESTSSESYTTDKVTVILLTNWGKPNLIGLTSIDIIDPTNESIPIQSIEYQNPDIFPSTKLMNIINSEKVTTHPEDMWSEHYTLDPIIVNINLEQVSLVAGIRFWNYNPSIELSYAGVKQVSIVINKQAIVNRFDNSTVFMLRRAPGNLHYNFCQEINFFESDKSESGCGFENGLGREEHYDCPNLPQGFVFQVLIFSTYGDSYYVGLNGIQLFDEHRRKINLTLNSKYSKSSA